MGVVGTARATAYEDAFASLAWIGSGTRLAVLNQLEILARDTTWFVHSVMLKAQKNDQPLIQVQLQVLELVRERLLLAGYVFPHDGKETDLHLRLVSCNEQRSPGAFILSLRVTSVAAIAKFGDASCCLS